MKIGQVPNIPYYKLLLIINFLLIQVKSPEKHFGKKQ